jgi:signal transduction histidine kinase
MRGRVLTALGLRGRIVGVVLVTAVAALAAAAVALLGPLESSLRSASMKTLQAEVRGATANFNAVRLADLPVNSSAGRDARVDLAAEQQLLDQRFSAIVAVLGYPEVTGKGRLLLRPQEEGPRVEAGPYDDATAAFRFHKPRYSFGFIDGTEYARAALPFRQGTLRYVMTVRRAIDEIPRAASAVRTAFLIAALVALALTLLLGIPLSARISRRLRLLRHYALRLAREGPSVEVPADRARDEVGDLARAFVLMRDQLRQQEEARRAFVATASHELRTPLATLEGMLELLEEELRSESPDLMDAHELLERARAQSHRLGRLAADLLDLSRLDAQVELRSEPIELSELSRAVLAEFELGTTGRRISTSLDDAPGPVWAMADPGSVARIVRILVDNAVRLSPEGSQISVELRNGERASLSVCDEGPGILPEERELIFERFMRGRQTAGQGGFGLGLAIGRELAERMGGELVLEDRDGPGARFTLRLPVAGAPDEEPVAVG